ncbi:alpha/beta hydrolase [Nonomuraea gerenzanensis]|uniref:6-hexanolactone hydrolase n=1 Tax=Nonomuraea gerenzanensis TaxID=93944 RepID=A0A1M4EDE4_9ACTN|nr:alpha/beta hydrolase [Nonomuraea gerenzanensis]UBU08641.1 alpha/beta hydrolase [Nonomuraea gerenzanensis]SBO97001.1 6-hexanolactone hydrolase [Nonomuraea gerenzanensis]
MPSITHLPASLEEAAAVRARMGQVFSDPPVLDGDADLTAVLPETGGVPGTWVTADRASAEAGVTVYVHGGGFSFSNPPMERIMAHRLSRATGRPAFAVDYRLAPAHPYPAAVEDVLAVYRSLLRQGVPAGRILLVGESAGGTLILSALLMLAEAGDPMPGGAVPVSPVTDLAPKPVAATDGGRDSIDPAIMGPVADQYLAGARPDRAPQSPIYGDPRGLPPLLLAVGGDEVLLRDTHRFAEAASAAGVRVDLDVYEGMPHAFHAAVLFAEDARPSTATTFLSRLADWAARLPEPADRV